jgi:hypothetical protein
MSAAAAMSAAAVSVGVVKSVTAAMVARAVVVLV